MVLDSLDKENFLHFHVKKGVERGTLEGLVTLRSTTIDNVIATGKPLLVTATDEEGIMILTPDRITQKILFESEKVYGRTREMYKLIRVEWLPTNEDTLMILNKLYTMQREFMDDIREAIKIVSRSN